MKTWFDINWEELGITDPECRLFNQKWNNVCNNRRKRWKEDRLLLGLYRKSINLYNIHTNKK